MNKLILLLFLLCGATTASAQFTQRFNTAQGEVRADSVARRAAEEIRSTNTQPEALNFKLYSDAYDQYVRRELFRQRNKIKIRSGLTLSQTLFDNWAAGGNSSFALRAAATVEHTYTHNSFNVKSVFDGAYQYIVTEDYSRKGEDFLNVSCTPNLQFAKRWELSGSGVLKTQFANSYKAPDDTLLLSSFFAPATFNISAGVSYIQPNTKLKVYLSPLSGNLVMVFNKKLADKGGFGMEPGTQFEAQVGMFLRVEYGLEFLKKKISYTTKMETFWRYDRESPTLWWENKINFKFTDLFGASFYCLLIYNDMIKTPRVDEKNYWQINETLGLSLTFNLDSKPNRGPSESSVTRTRQRK